MASFDYRLNPVFTIKECSSCGNLHTKDCGCSKGSLEDKILVPVPDLSQRPLKIEIFCLDCGDPVHGLYCRQCALIRKTLEEVFQDFQDTSKSSDDDTNFVNQEPFVVKQGPGVNSSQSPPQINHNCCYECGDSLDDIFCQRCTYCGGPHETFQCQPMNEDYYHEQNSCYDSNSFGFDQTQPPQYTVNHPIFNAQNDFLNSQNKLMEQMTSICDMVGQYMQKKEEEKRIAEEQAAKDRYWKIPICYDDDEDYTIAIDPSPSTRLTDPPTDTTPEDTTPTRKGPSSLLCPLGKDYYYFGLIPQFLVSRTLSKSQVSPKILLKVSVICLRMMILLKNHDRFDVESYLLESLVNRDTLMASPPKIDFILDEFAGELTRLQSIPPGIDNVNLDPEGDILFLESLLYDNSSPRPPEAFQANSNMIIESLPIFVDALREEIDILHGPDDAIPPGIESDDFKLEDDDNSTSHPEFESFHVDYPDSGDSTIDVVEDIPVDVPNILATHPTLLMDFDFIPSNDLGFDLDVSSPFGDSNKIYDPGICIEVKSMKFLAHLSLVIDNSLPFSSENEVKVSNHDVLASKEKSPPSSSHRGFKASKLFHQKSPMLIHGDNTPNLGVRHPHFYPP
ncbi:hypothetical protein Tco_1178938 [Tanacetum coccineum]